MRVQRVLMPGSGDESWTVLGDDQVPVGPAERFLAYLASIDRSPNTVRAYAHDLKDWFGYLAGRGASWDRVTLEDAAGFIAWLRLPPPARSGKVSVLPSAGHYCSPASVNRKLAAVSSFCEFHARHTPGLAGLLVSEGPDRRRSGATSYKPFLQHISGGGMSGRRAVRVREGRVRPRVLMAGQAQAILDACGRLRDRLLFALLLDSGMRIGEALGLRHQDMDIAGRAVAVTPRRNDNGARAKGGIGRVIPVSAELMRLYASYLTGEYGALDSDYVFVNLWAEPLGRPLTYAAAYDLVVRLRRHTGIGFEPDQFRHTYATWLLRKGAGMESVKELLGHASVTTTIDTYGHLTAEDARRTLEAAGWFTGREVRL